MATATQSRKSSRGKKKVVKGRAKHRASWKGQLRFGLVSFPVQAFNAAVREQGQFHFHMLHAECHRQIHYQKVCPVHGEVAQDEIVSGYEYRKGEFVEIDADELDELRTDSERALTIDAFVEPDTVDAIYDDGRVYYLTPDGKPAAEAYAVLEQAMSRQRREGIGQVVFSGREQLVRLRAVDGVLTMVMLNYAAQVKAPSAAASELPDARASAKNVQLAEQLIEAWTPDDFDFDAYEDRYRQRVKKLIDAKVEGRELVAPEPEEQPKVINLMDALKQSVVRGRPEQGEARRARGKSSGKRASRSRRAS